MGTSKTLGEQSLPAILSPELTRWGKMVGHIQSLKDQTSNIPALSIRRRTFTIIKSGCPLRETPWFERLLCLKSTQTSSESHAYNQSLKSWENDRNPVSLWQYFACPNILYIYKGHIRMKMGCCCYILTGLFCLHLPLSAVSKSVSESV